MAYTGQDISIPLGLGGFNGDENVQRIPITDLVTAKNIRFDGNAIRKVGGLKIFDTISGTPDIKAIHDWNPTSTVQRIVTCASDGNIYKETSDDLDAVTLKGSLTFSEPVSFIEGGELTVGGDRILYIVYQGATPQVLTADGATTADVSNPSTDWSGTGPRGGFYHDGRVMLYMGHVIYASSVTDHQEFRATDLRTGIFDIAPGEGQWITAGFSFLPTRAYIGKYPKGLYWVDTTNISGGFIPVTKVRDDLGIAGPNAWARVGADAWFIGTNGHIYSLIGVENLGNQGDLRDADITSKLNLESWIRNNVDLDFDKLKFAKLLYDANRKELWATFISKSSGGLTDIGFVIDVSEPSAPRIGIEDRGEYFEGMMIRRDDNNIPEVFCGGTGGIVYEANDTNRRIGGSTAYDGRFRTVSTDFGFHDPTLRMQKKKANYLEVTTVDTGAHTLTADVYWDNIKYDSYSFELGSTGSALGDTDYGLSDASGEGKEDFILGGLGVSNEKVRIGGKGRRMAVEFSNNTANEDFGVSEMVVGITPLGDTAVNN